jgi:Icc-related predicted phosphoesterase
MPIKIVAISDTHNAHGKLSIPECDILIHAGDESMHGSATEIMAFAEWFEKQPAKHLVWIPGNHSLGFEAQWPHSLNWVKHCSPRTNVLINQSVVLEGLSIWGSPVTPWFHDWAYNVQRGPDIRAYWNKIPVGTNIVVTHGPPYHIMDTAKPGTSREAKVGCAQLLDAIWRVKPKLHIFGHIHEGYGVEKYGDTTFVNAAIMSDKYIPSNKPIVIEYEDL